MNWSEPPWVSADSYCRDCLVLKSWNLWAANVFRLFWGTLLPLQWHIISLNILNAHMALLKLHDNCSKVECAQWNHMNNDVAEVNCSTPSPHPHNTHTNVTSLLGTRLTLWWKCNATINTHLLGGHWPITVVSEANQSHQTPRGGAQIPQPAWIRKSSVFPEHHSVC